MRQRVCLFRRHDWHSRYDHESKTTTWSCSRCGAQKGSFADGNFIENIGRKDNDKE